jgi:hypothetical protein
MLVSLNNLDDHSSPAVVGIIDRGGYDHYYMHDGYSKSRCISAVETYPHIQLYHAKSSLYFGESRDRITRLLRLAIQTGLLTSILALPVAPLYSQGETGIYALT